MSNLKLEVKIRSPRGTKEAKELRRQGYVPAILYGRHLDENIPLMVNAHDFAYKIQHSEAGNNTIFELIIDNNGQTSTDNAIPHMIQRDPLTDNYLNIDFYQVNLKEKIHAKVRIQITGRPSRGVKNGGQLMELINELELYCLPNDLPPRIDLDVSKLDLDQEIRVSDLDLPDTLKIMNVEDDPIIVRIEKIHEVIVEEGAPEAGKTIVAGEAESATAES